jgi:UDP-glucose 4-epimerase
MPETIAITGVSGYLGQALAEVLQADERVGKIVGVDLRPPKNSPAKLEFHQLDITNPKLPELIASSGATRIAHLAFLLNPTHDREAARKIDVEGTRNVLTAVRAARLRSLILASSSVVFGAFADNPVPLTESHPVRPDPNVQYMLDKVTVEQLALAFACEEQNCSVSILRPVTIVGPGMNNFISNFLSRPLLTIPRRKEALWQAVHERDCARAFAAALFAEKPGVFHVAADDWYPFAEMVATTKKPWVRLPLSVLTTVTDLGWATRIKALSEVPGALVRYLCYLPVLSNEKLKRELNFTFEYDSRAAMETYFQSLRK